MADLKKLTKRQNRPKTGDLFEVVLDGGERYEGVVLDAESQYPVPSSILAVIFSEPLVNSVILTEDLGPHKLAVPAFFSNPRPWSLGYARIVGHVDNLPDVEFYFRDPARNRVLTKKGTQVDESRSGQTALYGLGNEKTLADALYLAEKRAPRGSDPRN